jgi:hypothetical protein
MLALEDPGESNTEAEFIFLIIYTVECGLKIGGLGIILPKNAYLREGWNILDFAIVASGWISYSFEQVVNFSVLRSLRILRPLRSISSIEGLRLIFLALIGAIPLLIDTFLLLLFFFLIFAIAGQ